MAAPSINLHFVFFPYYDSGHILPMVDIARVIAQRGATVTIVTTPAVVNRFKPTINRAIEAKLKIQLLELPLPLAEFGLPEGYEDSKSSLKTTLEQHKIWAAIELLEKPAEDLLRELSTPPDCIISDYFFSWTTEVARKFNVPRLLYNFGGCFYMMCQDIIINKKIFQQAECDTERMVLPGLPDRVEITKLTLVGRNSSNKSFITGSSEVEGFDQGRFFFRCMQAESASYGLVVNSFEELEPEYAKIFPKERGTNVYCVGPGSLYNKDGQDKVERGSKAAIDDHYCLQWLNQREVESVLYVSFGTVVPISTKHLIEIGLGLESTNKPFIWCVRNKSKEFEKWLAEFEERVRDRGLIVHGWAPQVLILSHPSIGGFLTHCGWNSTLETISAGVPVITWPFCWDQFYNEIYMVQILKIGVSLGVEEAIISEDPEDREPLLVKKEGVKTAVNLLLAEDGIGKECRKRARKLAEMANRAMAEGGSSYLNVSKMFQDVSDFRRAQEKQGVRV